MAQCAESYSLALWRASDQAGIPFPPSLFRRVTTSGSWTILGSWARAPALARVPIGVHTVYRHWETQGFTKHATPGIPPGSSPIHSAAWWRSTDTSFAIYASLGEDGPLETGGAVKVWSGRLARGGETSLF